ncbi:hypothetical protein L1987_21182 [Smallanthus sonchifolius]|uniref:Uncharacterized protein n=1 Tax=Smallanthus sonchifolius TaxID=185202 RepID=A0ACB9IVC6_9ASTR|nr:hypothetical protein L1987_21182 [Smallanthus sonchifolius]
MNSEREEKGGDLIKQNEVAQEGGNENMPSTIEVEVNQPMEEEVELVICSVCDTEQQVCCLFRTLDGSVSSDFKVKSASEKRFEADEIGKMNVKMKMDMKGEMQETTQDLSEDDRNQFVVDQTKKV